MQGKHKEKGMKKGREHAGSCKIIHGLAGKYMTNAQRQDHFRKHAGTSRRKHETCKSILEKAGSIHETA